MFVVDVIDGPVDDDSTTDSYGDTCSWYDGNPGWCGSYDDEDFDAARQCCACDNCDNDDSTTDSYEDTCSWYEASPSDCGRYDDDDFTAVHQCCVCKVTMSPSVLIYEKKWRKWKNAKNNCMAKGGDLVAIPSAGVNNRVFRGRLGNWVGQRGMWIGGNDLASENDWMWSNTGVNFQYANWWPGSPDGGDCAYMVGNSNKWSDHNCWVYAPSICEIPSRYTFSSEKRSWFKARKACKAMGGDLATVMNENENEQINLGRREHYLWKYRLWIGLHDNKNEGVFRWAGKKTTPVYTAWANSEPTNSGGSENCVHMNMKSGTWNDNNCRRKYYYVCENAQPFAAASGPPAQQFNKAEIAAKPEPQGLGLWPEVNSGESKPINKANIKRR